MEIDHYRLLPIPRRRGFKHIQSETVFISQHLTAGTGLGADVAERTGIAGTLPGRGWRWRTPAQVSCWRCCIRNSAEGNKIAIDDSLNLPRLRARHRHSCDA